MLYVWPRFSILWYARGLLYVADQYHKFLFFFMGFGLSKLFLARVVSIAVSILTWEFFFYYLLLQQALRVVKDTFFFSFALLLRLRLPFITAFVFMCALLFASAKFFFLELRFRCNTLRRVLWLEVVPRSYWIICPLKKYRRYLRMQKKHLFRSFSTAVKSNLLQNVRKLLVISLRTCFASVCK